jgi:4-amino-4-deoxychorismate lyase
LPAILINGQPTEHLSVLDRGFQYGDGLFETLRVSAGKPARWARHMQRLSEGCRRLGIAMPEPALLYSEAMGLCAGQRAAVLKITVTRGSSERGYRAPHNAQVTRVVGLFPAPDFPQTYWTEGVAVRMCETRLGSNPALAGIKHLNRLEQVLARAEWGSEGDGEQSAEGLMMDEHKNIIEGTMSNLFCVQHEKHGPVVRTPALDRCGVRGVTRDCILEVASAAKIPAEESVLTLDDVHSSQELFLSNTLIGIWPVRQLEGQTFPVGPLTRQLSQALEVLHD